MNGVEVVTAPLLPAVSLAEAKSHLAVDASDNDTLIELLVAAATDYAESFMGRALVERTLDYFIDAFPDGGRVIRPPMPPLIDVVGLFYIDSAGDEQEFTAFEVDTASEPARLYLAPSNSWPTPRVSANAVRVRYRAGHSTVSGSPPVLDGTIPPDIKAAILLTAGTLFEFRETVTEVSATQVPWSAEQLLRRHRVELSAA
jgi:uncharacterized phiE125 gp8 family phage protein